MKIGIIREGKIPPDSRVPLTPAHCSALARQPSVELLVAPSPIRCYGNEEYEEAGLTLRKDLSDCELLLGVKEAPIEQLMPNKTYCFFSHTIKAQPYNRDLLRTILAKNIRLIDYEVLTDGQGRRLIAFGYFAGMVGAYNGLLTYGRRTGAFQLMRVYKAYDYAEAAQQFEALELPPIKIVLTGTGRVGSGAKKVLVDMGIREVSPQDYLQRSYDEAVFTQIDADQYAERRDGGEFALSHFFQHPEQYRSKFAPFARASDLMINGIFWDKRAPAFFTLEEMKQADFKIKVIADITCDIAPESSIPATLRATTIADPIFGFDPQTGRETAPHQDYVIDMMTIDNLPNELPRDASKAFGDQFIEYIWPEFLQERSDILERATIADGGKLGKHFGYLEDYVKG